MYTIILAESIDRDNVVKELADFGIETRCSFPPMHRQPAIIDYLGDSMDKLNLGKTYTAWKRIINLPIWSELDINDQQYIIDKVNKIVQQQS